jgi:hypothetical protein
MHFKALRGGSSDSYVRLPEDYSSGEKTSDEFDLFHLFSLIVARAQVLHQLRESKGLVPTRIGYRAIRGVPIAVPAEYVDDMRSVLIDDDRRALMVGNDRRGRPVTL